MVKLTITIETNAGEEIGETLAQVGTALFAASWPLTGAGQSPHATPASNGHSTPSVAGYEEARAQIEADSIIERAAAERPPLVTCPHCGSTNYYDPNEMYTCTQCHELLDDRGEPSAVGAAQQVADQLITPPP